MDNYRRLRVLHVVFSLDAGGMENGVVNVSSALSGPEFEFDACCISRGGLFVRRFPSPDCVKILGKKEWFSPTAVAGLSRHIRKVSPDVIHTHNVGPLIYAALAAPRLHNRILHGEHAELTPSELSPRRQKIRRFLYGHVKQVHTVSHALRASLIRQGYPEEKIAAVVNGVDTARFSPGRKYEARRETGLPMDALILGLVGKFGAYKRHAELIAAFEQLAPSYPRLALALIGGGGPLEEATRQLAAASPLASRIHFSGFQPDPVPWYRSLDLLVIPSVNEGLSNALLEAMACAVPALGHTACGNADVITDNENGYLEDIGTTPKLVKALTAALGTPEALQFLGRAARRRVERGFPFENMAAGYRELYRKVAGVG